MNSIADGSVISVRPGREFSPFPLVIPLSESFLSGVVHSILRLYTSYIRQ